MKIKSLLSQETRKEKIALAVACAVFVIGGVARTTLVLREKSMSIPVAGGTYREGIVGQPIAINPLISTNPADLDISALIYDSIEDIAAAYEKKDEGKTYSVKIKQDLVWSNGQPLNADDVIFTIETIQNRETQSPLRNRWEGIAVKRISELQVEFSLPNPFVFFSDTLKGTPVMPRHLFGPLPEANLKLSGYNLEPVGSGPYKFEGFVKRKDGFIAEYHLSRNDKHGGEKPYLDKIVLRFFEKEEEAERALQRRQIDGMGFLNARPRTAERSIREYTIPAARYYAVFFNQNLNPLLKEKGLRNALRGAVNKTKLMEEIKKNLAFANAVESPMLDILGSADEEESAEQQTTAREMARADLEKWGGEGTELSFTLITPAIPFLEQTAEILKKQWEEAGVTVHIERLPLEELLETVIQPNNYELLLFGNAMEQPEDLFMFWHSQERFYPGANLALYKNPRADAIMEDTRKTEDKDTRKELLRTLQAEITEDVPAVFLYTVPYIYLQRDTVKGFTMPQTALTAPHRRFDVVEKWHMRTARVVQEQKTQNEPE